MIQYQCTLIWKMWPLVITHVTLAPIEKMEPDSHISKSSRKRPQEKERSIVHKNGTADTSKQDGSGAKFFSGSKADPALTKLVCGARYLSGEPNDLRIIRQKMRATILDDRVRHTSGWSGSS